MKNLKILIIAAGGIGDVLMTTPMFRAIKKKYSNAFIQVVVIGAIQKTILENSPSIDNVIVLTEKKYNSLYGYIKLILEFRKSSFDYCFFNHIVERRKLLLAPFFAGIKHRIGFNRSSVSKKKSYKWFLKFLTIEHEYHVGKKRRSILNLDLLKWIDITDNNIEYQLSSDSSNIIKNDSTQVVGIHPGSDRRGKIKRWSIENFNQVAHKINNLNITVKFFIGPDESELINAICNDFEIINSDLNKVIDEISKCDYFISNDSGLAHIAAAYKIPTITIYGPTLSNEYILPTQHMNIELDDLFCRPCFHKNKPCPYNKECLENLSADKIFEGFLKLKERI